MPGVTKNLRNHEVTTASGKDVKDTMMIKGEAKNSAAFTMKNSMKEYSSGPMKKGPMGGKPSHG